MAYATATFPDVTPFDGRVFACAGCRRIFGGVVTGLGTVAATGAIVGCVTVAAVWMVGAALSANPHIHTRAPFGPATIALANDHPSRAGAADDFGSATIWTKAAYAPHLTRAAELTPAAVPTPAPANRASPAPRRVAERATRVPLPRSRPAMHEIARSPVEKPAPQVAAVSPPPAAPTAEKRSIPPRAPNDSILPAAPGRRTAIYDIEAHTVYLPDGERLEAHSGLGWRLDDPRYVNVKDRGPTPPNVYDLALREQLFHGVRAIRLNPVDDGKMFGRDGMLAHTYMLGPSGQSFGCVSFKDYSKFLTAFLRGEVDRLVVVPRHGAAVARALHPRHGERYAFNNR